MSVLRRRDANIPTVDPETYQKKICFKRCAAFGNTVNEETGMCHWIEVCRETKSYLVNV